MIVTFLKNNWKLILIGILLGTIFTLAKVYFSEVKDRQRLENNMNQLTMDHKAQVLHIVDQEQKKYLISKDSLAVAIIDSLNLRPAKIKRIINTKYIHIYDTVTVYLTDNNQDSTFKDFQHTFDACASTKGRVNCNTNVLIFDEFINDVDITTLHYWDRKHRWLWILSKKQHFSETINNCNGESTSREIIFEKR